MSAVPPRLLLDAGALVHAESHPRGKVTIECNKAVLSGHEPLLPMVVWAQVWRASPRQHALARIRRGCEQLPFDDRVADAVGRLLAHSGTSDVVDAAVVVAAIEHNAAVLTSDPQDLEKLADALGYRLPIVTV